MQYTNDDDEKKGDEALRTGEQALWQTKDIKKKFKYREFYSKNFKLIPIMMKPLCIVKQ